MTAIIIIGLLVAILMAIIAPKLLKGLIALPIVVALLANLLSGVVDNPLYYALWIVTGLFIAGGIVEVGKQIKNFGDEP